MPVQDQPNIAIVVLDTLRKDHFEEEFGWVTGKEFHNAYSTANWTIPAHASIFTGEYPSEVGVHSKSPDLDVWERSLPTLLREEGYRTTMFTANPNLSGRAGWKEGFDVVRGASRFDTVSLPRSLEWPNYLSDENRSDLSLGLDVTRGLVSTLWTEHSTYQSIREGYLRLTKDYKDGGSQALIDELKEADFGASGEFLFVNIMDCHAPYYPPKPYRTVDGEVQTYNWEPFVDGVSNRREIKAAYRDSVKYVSDRLKEPFELLRSEFDYVVITSDHGEMLGERGMVDHLYGLYPELVRVPLVVSGERVREEGVDDPVSLIDIYDTVVDLANVDVECSGESLLTDVYNDTYLVEYQGFPPSVRDKFLSNGVAEELYSTLDTPLFGYVTAEDGYVYESHDRGLQSDDVRQPTLHHEEKLDELLENAGVQRVSGSDNGEISDELLTRLEDLGYA